MLTNLSDRSSLWGVWDPLHGLDSLALDRWELRRDLTGLTFTTATAHEPPYVDSREINMDILESYNFPRGYQVLTYVHGANIAFELSNAMLDWQS